MPKTLIALKAFIAFIVCGVLLTIVWLFIPRPESARPADDSNAQQAPSEPAKPIKPQPLSAAEKEKEWKTSWLPSCKERHKKLV
jgi:hypothetical protein